MSLFDSMNIASTALSAQTTRINTIASNMANANSVSSTAEDTFKARAPIFQAVLEGEGISLGFEHSIGDLVAKGKLVTLTEKYWDTGRGYYLAIKSNKIDNPQVRALGQWLLASF